MKNIWFFLGAISTLLILAVGCAKQTKATKPYHDLTGRYNAYYNANIRLEESFAALKTQYQDNYNKLLHLYPYAAVESVASVKEPLDEAITKSSRNIVLHEIGDWTDNSYLLMGKAEFLQQEYDRAANTFKFIFDKYHPEIVDKKGKTAKGEKKPTVKKKKKRKRRKVRRKRVKRKKKRKAPKKKTSKKSTKVEEVEEEEPEKPLNYGLKHRPVRHEATLWLAKTHIELQQFDEAGYYLRMLENDLTVPYKLRPRVQAVIAYSWLQQKEYAKAIEPLELAIAQTKGQKGLKNRYVYLLAQLQQKQGNNQAAMENFRKVLRLRPSYVMEFNARLNMAKNAAQASGTQRVDPEVALKRMLRDSKNEEYKDQIYFALAEIQLARGNKDLGIAALQKSLYNSSNPAQRAEGALLLAQLFYERDDFVQAYAYYDTTSQEMKENDERYAATDTRKRRLEGLAKHLSEKAETDSLLIVSSWPRAKQERWAVAGLEQEELRGTDNSTVSVRGGSRELENRPMGMAEETGRGNLPNRPQTRGATGQVKIMDVAVQRSKFALYNASIQKKGEREFEKRWDNRSWVDNWRRSNKEEVETADADVIATAAPKTQAEIDGYLKRQGVPASDQERDALRSKLGEALFFAARHYREDLRRSDKALELVNQLVKDHPKSPYTVEALFLAYNIYSEKNDANKTAYYKAQILNNYPESNIAKVLSDPDFANSEKEKYKSINAYYDETYQLMRQGNAQQALERVQAVPAKFGKDYEMKRRFAILEAMCIGGVKGEQDYIRALRTIVTSYPDTEESEQASKMIAFLKGEEQNTRVRNNNNNVAIDPTRAGELYRATPDSKHLVLLVFDDQKARTNPYRAPITEFNNKYYLNKRLSTSSILVDGKTPTLTIRGSFNNAEEAMKYVLDITTNKEFLAGVNGYRVYAISKENYAIAMTKQKFVLYDAFFKKNYN